MKNLTPKQAGNIIDNYVNGNITDAKNLIKKLTIKQRKQLYNFAYGLDMNETVIQFFFNQI